MANIPVKMLNLVKLHTLARDSFAKEVNRPANAVTLSEKIVVNFIRHKLTPYDAMMDKTRGDKDGFARRAAIRQDTLKAIAIAYGHIPYVVHETHRQLTEVAAEADRRNTLAATPTEIAAYRATRNQRSA
jgi:hypothetical protein